MSLEGSYVEEIEAVEVLYVAEVEEGSEDPPMEEWSSLLLELPETNKKKLLYEIGQYYPGSGEICTKYAAMSDSRIIAHPLYKYPAVSDPGIEKALLKPERPIIFSDDGQERYLAVCTEMGQCPVRRFYRGLVDEEIDLRYYSVDPKGVRPMALALKYNKRVKVLNFMDNFLSDDACYHLGEMLMINSTLCELNLAGCRIGPGGTKRLFSGLPINRALKVINLNRNQIGDVGVEYIAKAVVQGLSVQKIYLSYNNIGAKCLNVLAEALETHSHFVVLDLSWNYLNAPGGTFNFLTTLGESLVLQEVNLSWNTLAGARMGIAIKNLMKTPNLKYLNISNNKLAGDAIQNIISVLTKTKKLMTLDVSFNPLSLKDALAILQKMKLPAVKLQKVIMENVFVNREFLELLDVIKLLKFRKNFVITYGGVIIDFVSSGPDMRELLLNRAEFLAKKSKKHPVDIVLVALQLLKDNNLIMESAEFARAIKATGAPLDEDLVTGIMNVFAGPPRAKTKTIDIELLVGYLQRKWPDRKLPPTPPPEPEPVIVPSKGKKGKNK